MVYHMQDIKINVITYKCLNKNFPIICLPHLQPLSRERDCLCNKQEACRENAVSVYWACKNMRSRQGAGNIEPNCLGAYQSPADQKQNNVMEDIEDSM